MHVTWKLFVATTFLCITYTTGHGTMVIPYNWFDTQQKIELPNNDVYDFIGMKSGMQCKAGCKLDGHKICPRVKGGCSFPAPGCSCFWFRNFTHIAKPTIFKKKYLTYYYTSNPSRFVNNPWRAPGKAYINTPCGAAGGNMYGCIYGNCNIKQGGYGYGVDLLSFKLPHKKHVTWWKRGEVVEAVWGIVANHGGGYSYRLCKVPPEGVSGITEEICQKIPLKFFGNIQWAQYGEDKSTRVSFPAVRLTKGTYPAGSQWTKNPIPACKGDDGGILNPSKDCHQGYQFPPPGPGLHGYGINKAHNYVFQFSIIDKLVIPKDIVPGEYVLSFRWDCEQSPQVWNSCASVHIE